ETETATETETGTNSNGTDTQASDTTADDASGCASSTLCGVWFVAILGVAAVTGRAKRKAD
ncbi:MAG: hypothetical protein DBX65_01190, partial [Oscillospiraceae bacterium]